MPAAYLQEFGEDVVRVARSRQDGVTLARIAKDFCIHEMTLHKWVRQAAVDDGNRPCRSREESTELREARRRIRLGGFKRWAQGTLRASLMVSDSPASCVAGR
ncbi:transposase [Kytococcus sedentarius]|nr:transposase [Kytococcus sedentarius]STX13895.1 Uncharacterised protein [Kytococcus sedentarius]